MGGGNESMMPAGIMKRQSFVASSLPYCRDVVRRPTTPLICNQAGTVLFASAGAGASIGVAISLNTAKLLGVGAMTGKVKLHFGQGSASVFCS